MALVERRYSQARGRQVTLYEALGDRFVASPFGRWVFIHVAPRVDRRLIPATNGTYSFGGRNIVGLLTSTGAKSGVERRQPLTCIPYGDDLLLAGSNYGREKHPAWSHNLIANPACRVTFRGPERAYRARLLEDDEYDEAWAYIIDLMTVYEAYRQRIGGARKIRVFRLEPTEPGVSS